MTTSPVSRSVDITTGTHSGLGGAFVGAGGV